MTDFPRLFLFGADLLVTLGAAWLLVRCAGPGPGVIERLLGWGLAMLLLVVGAGEVAGWCGALGLYGFFTTHALGFLALAGLRRTELAADKQALHALGREVAGQFRTGGPVAWLGAVLLLVLAGSAGLAVRANPLVFDALTYRLSRIGLWLQEGRIAHFATDDARLNYMPVAPDLVMAWLMGAHAQGYPWVALAQTFGGALLLGGTAGLARCAGLGRTPALGAAALTLGLASVVPQLTSAYTDLFTAGVFAAAFYLWLAALRRQEGSVLGGAGVALAFGAKGTMFYLAPGALLVVAWLGWRERAAWPAWRRTALAGVVAAALLVVPGLVRNVRTYGGLFGPRESMQQQHGEGFAWQKLSLNLTTTLAQLLEPNAQPPGLKEISQRAGQSLARGLPAADPFSFEGIDRRAEMEKVLRLPAPDADVVSCGVLPVLLGLAGLVIARIRARTEGAELVLLLGAGTVLFVVSLYGLLQWHSYSFRFWALVAPWMTVAAAWGLEALPRGLRTAGWVLATAATTAVFWHGTLHTYQAGWQAVARPERALSFSVYAQTRGWTRTLEPVAGTLQVAQPVNRPLAAFLRLDDGRRVELRRLSALPATAEAAVQGLDGWLVVPARHFAGHEGRVEKRTWFFYGDESSPFSLAAYRRVKATR